MAESDVISVADLGLPEDQETRATAAITSLEDIRNRAEAEAIRQTLKLLVVVSNMLAGLPVVGIPW